MSFFIIVGAVNITGPRNTTVVEGTNVFIRCSVTGLKIQPLLQWRISGIEYTPSTLPDRYSPRSNGLVIHPISLNDDGVTIQCFVVVYDNSVTPLFIEVNSTVAVLHVFSHQNNMRQVSSYIRLHDATPTFSPVPRQNITSIFPSPTNPNTRDLVPISTFLVVLLVAAVITLLILISVVLGLAVYITRKRRGNRIAIKNNY